jgi:hypothetical protein
LYSRYLDNVGWRILKSHIPLENGDRTTRAEWLAEFPNDTTMWGANNGYYNLDDSFDKLTVPIRGPG